jgi:uncharacterized protein with NRDE domain
MCLVLIAIGVVPRTPLLLLGNRDEFHGRASAAAQPGTKTRASPAGATLSPAAAGLPRAATDVS